MPRGSVSKRRVAYNYLEILKSLLWPRLSLETQYNPVCILTMHSCGWVHSFPTEAIYFEQDTRTCGITCGPDPGSMRQVLPARLFKVCRNARLRSTLASGSSLVRQCSQQAVLTSWSRQDTSNGRLCRSPEIYCRFHRPILYLRLLALVLLLQSPMLLPMTLLLHVMVLPVLMLLQAVPLMQGSLHTKTNNCNCAFSS